MQESTNDFGVDDNTYCGIAVDEALNSVCSGSDVAFREVALSFFGFTEEDMSRLFPIETKYRDVLDSGLIDGKCMDYAEIRMYILALAWDKMNNDGYSPKNAIRDAWMDVRFLCEEYGVQI
ncbi:MAG: hypothetical protein WC145_07460 [Aliarcobacter sp.]